MTAKRKKRLIVLAVVAALLLAMVGWIAWGNKALELSKYTVTDEKIPEGFDGFRIAQISDLHNSEMGKDNHKLLAMLRKAQPDMIAITGDIIDSRRTDMGVALRFAEEAVKIAPCYYVAGNHESRIAEYATLKDGLTELGVVVLDNKRVDVERAGEMISVLGVDDPNFQEGELPSEAAIMQSNLMGITRDESAYTILLSHKPGLFDVYVLNGLDLVLCGHMHGGQFRVPFLGGLYSPSQGFFPEYDAGLFTEGNTNMIVSRGIGNSAFPFRLNNRPEVVLITLKSERS